MIIIVLDEVESWFEYTWEQFVEVNSLNTEYSIAAYSDYRMSEYARKNVFMIEYSTEQRHPDSLFIPKKKKFKTDDYVWIREDLPVYSGTITRHGDNNKYDIFYNAFVHLSRLEEWETEKKGKRIHSYSFNHPRKDRRIWKIPVVNYLFEELEKKIKLKYPEAAFGEKAKPIIEFSHDVDYIHKTGQLRIKQALFHFFNSCRFLMQLDLKNSLSKFVDGVAFAFKNCDYWCFDDWTELENRLNIKSVYYFFARTNSRNLLNPKQWLLDPSYDIASNKRLREKCRELISNANRLGIHGSYASAENEDLFFREKEVLENTIDSRISKSRQHWLNYSEQKTPYIHKISGMEEDSTLGFNDIPGFRAGIASRYNPYDHKKKQPLPFREIPIVVMDSHLYDYSSDSGTQDLTWLTNSAQLIKNFMISIDWHQRVISQDYGWDKGVQPLIDKSMKDY